MNINNLWKRRFISLIAFVFGLAAFIPVAFAANPLILNTTVPDPDPFYFDIPGQSATLSFSYDYNTGGYPTGPVLEQVRDTDDNVIYEFGAIGTDDLSTGNYVLDWDGTYNNGGESDGENVPDGDYKIYVYSETPTPPPVEFETALFTAEKAVAATLEIVGDAPTVYYTGGSDLTLNYALTVGSGQFASTRLKVKGPLTNPDEEIVQTNNDNTDGNYSVSWDGKLNGNPSVTGEYEWTLWVYTIVNGMSMEGTTLNGTFNVVDDAAPTPTLSNVSADPDPYDPADGDVTLSYKLNGSLGYTSLNAEVFDPQEPSVAFQSWWFTNQGNGTNSVTWDGKDGNGQTVPEGAYVFKVWGSDGNEDVVSEQVSFNVETAEPEPEPEPGNECEGFTDVTDTDPLCPAIIYVKEQGIFEGYSDGTFQPDTIINRAETAKVILIGFSKTILPDDGTDLGFPDALVGEWYMKYIRTAKTLGIIEGYPDGTLKPGQQVNRVEMLKIFFETADQDLSGITVTVAPYVDVPVDASTEWYIKYVQFAKENALVDASPEGNFFPAEGMKRGDVAELFYRNYTAGFP